MKKLNNKKAYEILSQNHVHWDRKDKNHIVVFTLGYLTQDAHTIENFLNKAGMYAVDQKFDSICGKTATVYRHKAA